MIVPGWNDLWQALAAALVFAVAGYCLYRMRQFYQARLRQVSAAEGALRDHYDAVEYMLADPEFPSAAKDAIDVLAELVTDRTAGLAFGKALAERGRISVTSAASPSWIGDVNALQEKRADLVSAFDTAMRSACVAMLLRWPENVAVLDSLLADILADSRNDRALRRRLAEFIAANDTGSLHHRAA